jgi:tetratricopeptide (TPR) repeat protein
VPKESVLFGLAGVFFGLLVGWIIGSQQGTSMRPGVAPPAQASASSPGEGRAAPPPLDERRAGELKAAADRNPKDAESRVQLANLYFDADRYDDAGHWYEEALKVDPKNPNASTDLGITFYYRNQPDRALAQFERSLAIDPKHTKTWLNIGFVRAFGKEDLDGAAKAWQQVVEIAPDSPEGRAARQALEGLRSAHPGGAMPPAPPSRQPGRPD